MAELYRKYKHVQMETVRTFLKLLRVLKKYLIMYAVQRTQC